MTATSDLINDRLSFDVFSLDLQISATDQSDVVTALQTDANLDQTLMDLGTAGRAMIFTRMGRPEHIRAALEIIAGRARSQRPAARASLVAALRPVAGGPGGVHVGTVHRSSTWFGGSATQYFDICAALGGTARSLGWTGAATCAPPGTPYSGSATDFFTGSGGTGVSPADLPAIPLRDQAVLAIDNARGVDGPTTQRYSNPGESGNAGTFLAARGSAGQLELARQLVCQPVSTIMPGVYGMAPPSRRAILVSAAREYNLTPQVIGAFILAEQIDQSRNEDMADYQAATSIAGADTSIGLGQVKIGTAQRHDLFARLGTSASGLPHNLVAALLASDEFNIFAVAKYIRHIADMGARAPTDVQTHARGIFPGINMRAYSGHARHWSEDNVAALGSEYSSLPWDKRFIGWEGWVRFGYQVMSRDPRFFR
ncbi:MAG: hypothetical protein AAFV19_12915 [Pseudomonadota bacterium]